MPRLPGSKNKKPRKGPVLTEKKKSRGRPRKTPKPEGPKRPRGRPRKVKAPKVKKPVGRPKKEKPAVHGSKGSGMTLAMTVAAAKGIPYEMTITETEKGKPKQIKKSELEEIERELAPTIVRREKRKGKREVDESWEIRKEREPQYDPTVPLETSGGIRRKYTSTLEESVREDFGRKVAYNNLHGSYVINELMKKYIRGEVEIKVNEKDMAKWPWGLIEPNGEIVPAKPGTPVAIPTHEWTLDKEARIKRETEERIQKKLGSKKSFKCPRCKKGYGTLHVSAEDPNNKWYECDKCHGTWKRIQGQRKGEKKEVIADVKA